MVDLLLFPSGYFSVTKVEKNLQAEYAAVVSTGLFDVAIFGYDQHPNNSAAFFIRSAMGTSKGHLDSQARHPTHAEALFSNSS